MGEHGWLTPAQRALWHRRYCLEKGFQESATFQRFAAIRGALVTRNREQLVEDAEWYRSAEYHEEHRAIGLDDLLASHALDRDLPGLLGFNVNRALGRPRFSPCDRRMVRLFHHEQLPHIGRSLTRGPSGPPQGLPPRLRETLACRLEEDSEKQVALRLGLSRHTVHEYVAALYRRLGVSSPGELLAACLKNGSSFEAPRGGTGPGVVGRRPTMGPRYQPS
jgi:DNA-binding NarL/FixJ family response regulator